MSLVVEVKSDATPWHALKTLTTRNIFGKPAVAGTVTNGSGNDFPGVLRYRVVEIQNGFARVTCRIVRSEDSYHPLIDLVGTVSILIGQGVILPSARVGDEYEVGSGYYWSETSQDWFPVRAFGILLPDQLGRTLYIRVTNTGGGTQVFTQMSWTNTGASQFFSGRISGESWGPPGQTPLVLHDDQGVEGFIQPQKSCAVELRPEPGSDSDNSNNPITLDIEISSSVI